MHLLVVEDDVRLARSLTRLLTEDRHLVEHAATGREGLELAVAADGLDLVILDIGLAIAAWIVQAHDGTIELDERPGGGARFTISLPT